MDHLLQDLAVVERLDAMVDKCLKRLLLLRGLKSLRPVPHHRRCNPFQGRSAFQARRELRKHLVFRFDQSTEPAHRYSDKTARLRAAGGRFGEESASAAIIARTALDCTYSCSFCKMKNQFPRINRCLSGQGGGGESAYPGLWSHARRRTFIQRPANSRALPPARKKELAYN